MKKGILGIYTSFHVHFSLHIQGHLMMAMVQNMLGVHQPDFGYLTHHMIFDTDLPLSTALIQPRAEGAIAYILTDDLPGPGVTPEQVLRSAFQAAHQLGGVACAPRRGCFGSRSDAPPRLSRRR